MSLLNILSDKITGSVMSNNTALSKMTVTTLATAGTSVPNILKNTSDVAKNSLLKSTGDSGNGLYAPILSMRDYACGVDPSNISVYSSYATQVISGIDSNVLSSLPGSDNTLFDIQRYTKESLSSGVDSYSQIINKTNSALYSDATNIGVAKLVDTSRVADSSISTAYSTTNNYLNSTISQINSSVIEKAMADKANAVASDTALPLPVVTSGTFSTSSPSPYAKTISIKGVEEGLPVSAEDDSTDVLVQDVSLYIEGVQVPFESISISQSIGQLPGASIQIPPNSGLMDIIRGYQPKVHVFYEDRITGGYRLLFWGHIIACNYHYSQAEGGASISFECVHKNALLRQLTFEWSGGGAAHAIQGANLTDNNPDQASVQINNFNSEYSLARALQGITGVQSDPKDLISPSNSNVLTADPTMLDKRFEALKERMVGMPTTIMNMWNQVKMEVYADEKLNVIFNKMFVPLMEDGIRFFDRLSGHPVLEDQIDAGRVPYCNDSSRPELNKNDVMLPPAFRVGIQSAVQTQLVVNNLKSSLGFSGELANFYDLFANFYYGIEYEMLTLSSPGEVPIDPSVDADPDTPEDWVKVDKMAVETIVKPQIPFYYSPICNVILPNMFHTVDVNQNESDVPTRITAVGTAASQAADNPNLMGINYRAPQSIRESIALGRKVLGASDNSNEPTLRDTTGSSFNIPGKYEMGRGIAHRKIAMPNWLSHFVKDQDDNRASNSDSEFPEKGSVEAKNLLDLHYAWIQKYGYSSLVDDSGNVTVSRDNSKDTLDPYSIKSNIMAYERLLFATADYEYAKAVASSRNGSVYGLFNPYVVPGYPMDIIDGSPNHPCFHAMCASVTHSISARGIGTTIGFVAASTYTELSNYYMQPIHPWLKTALSLVNVERGSSLTSGGDTATDASTAISGDTTLDKASLLGITPDPAYDSNTGDITSIQQGIIDNPRAKEIADKFYRSVLGVCSADPGLIYNFETGQVSPVARHNGNWTEGSSHSDRSPKNGGEGNPNLTGVGNLRLVARQIEGKKSIESKFGLKFIDLTEQNYNGTSVTYQNKVAVTDMTLEPGASMFLDYSEISSLVNGD
jgi:hypothetical protein